MNIFFSIVVSLSNKLFNYFNSSGLLKYVDINLSNSFLSLVVVFWVLALILLGVLTLVLVVVYFF